jgi:PhnB protein
MPSILNPYISFKENARQAMEFYHGVFGGKLNLSTFKEFQGSQDPSDADKIMHGQLEAENGITLMGADTPASMADNWHGYAGSNITISLSGDNEAELRGYWDKLAAGATITMPLEQAPWGDAFGMLTDKFGVGWMVNIAGKRA